MGASISYYPTVSLEWRSPLRGLLTEEVARSRIRRVSVTCSTGSIHPQGKAFLVYMQTLVSLYHTVVPDYAS